MNPWNVGRPTQIRVLFKLCNRHLIGQKWWIMNIVHFFPTNFLQRAHNSCNNSILNLIYLQPDFMRLFFFSDDCYCGTLFTRMEGIGKRYTFLMRVLGKIFFLSTGGSWPTGIFFDGRQQSKKNIFWQERTRNIFWRETAKQKKYFLTGENRT